MAVDFFGRVWVKAFFMLLTAASFAQFATAQTLESNPEFDVGDKWTYRYQNTGDRKDPYLYTHQAYKSEFNTALLFYESQAPEANRKQGIDRYYYKRADVKERYEFNSEKPRIPGKRYHNSQPSDDRIQFPLTVGKKYNVKFDWGNGEGYTKYDVEVEAFEKIKVDAGEFDAYRIKLSGWWMRTSNGNYSGRAEFTLWYSPTVKRLVKGYYFDLQTSGFTWNANTVELVKWEPKAPLPVFLEPKAGGSKGDNQTHAPNASTVD